MDNLSTSAPVLDANATARASYVDWAPILAGTAIASAITIVLTGFGSVVGLSLVSPFEGNGVSGTALAVATGLWIIWVALSSLMAGAYLTGRMRKAANDAEPGEAAVRDGTHGLVVWALSVLIGAMIAAGGISAIGKTGGEIVKSGAMAATGIVGAASDYAVDDLTRSNIGGTPLDPDTRAQIGRIIVRAGSDGQLSTSDRAFLVRTLAASAGVQGAVVVNTCAVTAEAVRKAKQEIRRLAREHPGAQIIVTGCAAQTEPETFAAMPEVSRVIGNTEKMQASTWAALAVPDLIGATERVQVDDIMSVTETAGHLIDGFGRHRAYVQVQNGCDHRCTFCIIPFGRGNSRSVPAGVVVEQIRRLVGKGFHEVVLTGVDLTSWGADLPGAPRLGDLVLRILRLVPDLARLRISSIDSIEVDAALLAAIAGEARLMPHLHLSLQAGDDMILKRMKRRHMRGDAIAFCAEAVRLRPGMVFGADIIAGFPTETEAMFENSLRLVAECGLTFLHVFPYSARKGTPAARMPQLPGPVIRERAARLRAVGDLALQAHLAAQVGRAHAVLMEGARMGRTEGFAEVAFDADQPEGQIVQAVIKGVRGGRLVA